MNHITDEFVYVLRLDSKKKLPDRVDLQETTPLQMTAAVLYEQQCWYGIIPLERHVIHRNFLCEAVWVGGSQWNPWLEDDGHVDHLNLWHLYPCSLLPTAIWERA
jgi:hypothetical protein